MAQFLRIPDKNGWHIVNLEQITYIDSDYRNGSDGSVWYFVSDGNDGWIRCDWPLDAVAYLLAARTPKKREPVLEQHQSPLRDTPWCG